MPDISRIKRLICLLSFLFFVTNVFGQVDFTDSNLPIIVINTNNQNIVDDPKINCDMGIIWNGNGGRNYLTDPFNDYNGKIGIEIRGSTSQQYPKKSYGIETRDSLGNNLNVSLLGMPKENDWILYAPYPDKTFMRNTITYDLFGQMQPWSPKFVYCELVIDGQYMGVYVLIEKIKRDKNRVDIARLDIDDNSGDSLTGGYIIKIDKPTGSSSDTWTSAYQEKLKFLYHDPKYSELSSVQKDYIKNYVSDFENAVYSPAFDDPVTGYRSFINVESFIDFMLMQELGRTVDGYRSSSFMYKDKDSKGGRLTCGPMWDFNFSYGNADYCEAFNIKGWQYNFTQVCSNFLIDPPEWWPRLLQDTTFADELQCRWQYLRSTVLAQSNIENWIDSTALYLNEAQTRNFIRWPILGDFVPFNYFIGQTYQEEIDYLKWWFKARSEYMDVNLPGNCNLTTSVSYTNLSAKPVLVYPNPTTGILYTTAPIDANIKVLSIEGQEINFQKSETFIDLRYIPKGLYIIVINNQSFKVVKQ